jgi:hypothetical protein
MEANGAECSQMEGQRAMESQLKESSQWRANEDPTEGIKKPFTQSDTVPEFKDQTHLQNKPISNEIY